MLVCKNISEVQPTKLVCDRISLQLSADRLTEHKLCCLKGQDNKSEDSRSLTVNLLWINLTAIWIPICVANTNMCILKQQESSCERCSDKSAKEGPNCLVYCTLPTLSVRKLCHLRSPVSLRRTASLHSVDNNSLQIHRLALAPRRFLESILRLWQISDSHLFLI